MKEFTVNRSSWLRGVGDKVSGLLCHGKMCCLGFIAEQCGVPRERLDNRPMPSRLEYEDRLLLPDSFFLGSLDVSRRDSEVIITAAKINDDVDITDEIRERDLNLLLGGIDITLKFVD